MDIVVGTERDMEIGRYCGRDGKGHGDRSILRYGRKGTWRYMDIEVGTERDIEIHRYCGRDGNGYGDSSTLW
jgi:hypothetical protein